MENKKIEYLVGKTSSLNNSISPFNELVILFLDELSLSLNLKNRNKKFVDVMALSFFCRKKNILKLRKKYSDKSVRFGLGTLFHITPSNVPTNFAYSLIFGLLSGNSNIVKVPSKKYEEIKLICDAINKIVLKKFKLIKDMILIVRYGQFDEWTRKFSRLCDGRLIWGGDKTIAEIKKFETKPKNIDIPFSDRYSVSLINSEKFSKLSKNSKKNLIKNFYNDTYSINQNACSSPHIILWKGRKNVNAKKIFWEYLNELIKIKYKPPKISFMDNMTRLAKEYITNKDIAFTNRICSSLYVVSLKKIRKKINIKKSVWGFFFECEIRNLEEIINFSNRNLQTLTYFGFSKKELNNFFNKKNMHGIDRIIPIGQALNINLIWDGYDIIKILSREIDIL